ncbi:hypothetical protein B0H16DRAFT_1457257 [Mycena metata]|uniref:Uncharacterized protein n=1 Tax=Mycena metata TaxID=1033252 RepID=A0AAD7J7C5_9AGAR|nr:hypothetical protein B0H16DRAFT_1457257 [Mycena metata]
MSFGHLGDVEIYDSDHKSVSPPKCVSIFSKYLTCRKLSVFPKDAQPKLICDLPADSRGRPAANPRRSIHWLKTSYTATGRQNQRAWAAPRSRTPSNPPSEVKQASTNESKPVHGYTWGTVTHTLSLPLRGNKNAQTFVRSSNFSKVTTNVAFSKTSPFYGPSSDKENCYPENIDSMV